MWQCQFQISTQSFLFNGALNASPVRAWCGFANDEELSIASGGV
jgi:hypothetical protein